MPQAAHDLGYNDDTDSDLYRMYRLRNAAPADQLTHDLAGPIEHKEFMRETTERSVAQGTAAMAMAPAYSVAKALGLTKGRSRASVDEVFAAWDGYVQGLRKRK